MSEHSSRGRTWAATRRRILDRDNWTCQHCNKPLDGEDATVDHLTPKSKGGTDTHDNLVASCRSCNSSRGDTGNDGRRINYYNPRWFAADDDTVSP